MRNHSVFDARHSNHSRGHSLLDERVPLRNNTDSCAESYRVSQADQVLDRTDDLRIGSFDILSGKQ